MCDEARLVRMQAAWLFLYALFVTFPVACWCAKLCEVEVFLFSVLQFTEQRLLSVFPPRTKLLMEKIVPCEAGNAD